MAALEPQLIDIGALTTRVVWALPPDSTLASITASGTITAWTLGVLTPKWATSPNGPWFAFASGELPTGGTTIGPGEGSIPWANVQGKPYLSLEVTTAEAATPEWVRIGVSTDAT